MDVLIDEMRNFITVFSSSAFARTASGEQVYASTATRRYQNTLTLSILYV